ncbi:TetR/AcrR family transcriptional regulator [Caulobacter segnis]|uniref:TetR/AcrR family transcriptional regulator n=1 Tax=Caulobacter segnis TaxID=88688 RepID=UPI0024105F6E|nr:TetR/AcrR family transcriptional regulator [Caulobacter segnis]MDG2523450.1 TetR/AcrR family transcriptional regulator [Caulobacter segnis]
MAATARQTAATARYEAKKEAILAAATATLNRQGVKGMTMAGVAAEVGLITTSVTYYYRKKEDLAAACFLRGIERFAALVDKASTAATAQERLLAFLDRFLDLQRRVRKGEAPPLVSFTEVRTLNEPHRTPVFEAFNNLFRRVRELFDTPELADLSRAERNARTHLLLEQVFWTGTWLRRYETEDYGRVRDRMFDILTGGLAARAQDWNPPSLTVGQLTTDPQEASRETFLVAATRLINQRGYRGASVEDISAALNVTKGSFYHHNDAKDGLVVACFERTFQVMREAQSAARDLPGDQWSRLAAATSALARHQLSEHGPLMRASVMTALPADLRHDMSERYVRVSDRFSGMVSDGIAEGSIRAVDPMIAAHMLNSLLNAAASLAVWAGDTKKEDAASLLVRPLMVGIFRP